MLSAEDCKKLSDKFPAEKLGIKINSTSKDRSRALLVLYLQHTDVADRLDAVDPAWSFLALEEGPKGDLYYVKASLTVKNVTRQNIGEGNDPKGAYSDALKRCAMLFGVGRYLYDEELVWTPYNESQDKYKAWTYAEYERAKKRAPEATQAAGRPVAQAVAPAPLAVAKPVVIGPPAPAQTAFVGVPGVGSEYVVTFGKYKGKRLVDIDIMDLEEYAAFLIRKGQEDGKKPAGQVAAFLDATMAYCATVEVPGA